MITHDNVSIHAPARGATSWEYAPETGVYMFQFTLPRGERLHPYKMEIQLSEVSIHAPARGATVRRFADPSTRCFNSRSREGSDWGLIHVA